MGAAAVAGFLTATTLVPSKEEQALKKLAAIERALRQPAPPSEHSANGSDKPKAKGFLSSILPELLGVLKPVLANVLAGAVQGQAGGSPDDPSKQPDPAAREAGRPTERVPPVEQSNLHENKRDAGSPRSTGGGLSGNYRDELIERLRQALDPPPHCLSDGVLH